LQLFELLLLFYDKFKLRFVTVQTVLLFARKKF